MIANMRHAGKAALTIAIALITLAATASAQSSSMMATYICRPARSAETANAKMIATSASLVCKPFAVTLHMSDNSMKVIGSVTAKPVPGPNIASALTPAQFNSAYNRWIEQTMHIDPATEHTP